MFIENQLLSSALPYDVICDIMWQMPIGGIISRVNQKDLSLFFNMKILTVNCFTNLHGAIYYQGV